jgi:3-deoxy-D-manno-octulosonic-acid transferase
MSPRSARRHRALRWLAGGLWRRLDVVAAQNEEYADDYRALGVSQDRIAVTGSVKYDGVCADRDNSRTRELRRLLDIRANDLVLIAGSTQAPEEEIVLKIYRQGRTAHPNLRLIIVPRQKDRFDEVAALLERSGEPFVRRSRLSPSSDRPVVLLDTIGELGAAWGLADVAFVGGSLDGRRGGQNMIEPGAYGAAVLFGPHNWNFKETVTRLVEHHAAVEVADAAELEREVLRLLANAAARRALGAAAQRFVVAQQGATERTLDALEPLLGISRLQAHAA